MKRLLTGVLLLALSVFPTSAQTPETAEHIQPTIAENARHLLPTASTGEVSVIAYGEPLGDFTLPLVVRNDTEAVAANISVKVDVRDADGSLVGVASGWMKPAVLNPGDIAIGTVMLVDMAIPSDAVFEFSISSRPVGRMNEVEPDLEFGTVEWAGQALVGEMTNPSGIPISFQFIDAVCFDSDGALVNAGLNMQTLQMEAGETTTFQTGSFYVSDASCENFIVAGKGS
jgi:hypothetical protein